MPADWGAEIDGDGWDVVHGDVVHNIYGTTRKMVPDAAVVQDIHIPVHAHGIQKIEVGLAGFHEQKHEVDVDARETSSP